MSDSEEVVVSKRRTNRLNLDSEEEARRQAEEQQRIEQIRVRKEERRRKREEEARMQQEEQKRLLELERHFEDPRTMLEPDSDSKDVFERAQKKIQKAYPDFRLPKDSHRKKMLSESDESDSESEDEDSSSSQSESDSESQEEVPRKKKAKKQAKVEKKERKRAENMEEMRAARHKAREVKVQEKSPKEVLVGEVAVRWWYCLPEWPPADFDYEGALHRLKYRLVDGNKFRIEENEVNGLQKATPIEGYLGLYKTKNKIVDVRPKEGCPSLNFLRSKSVQELASLLREALTEQIKAINRQDYKTTEDLDLLARLTKRLSQLQ